MTEKLRDLLKDVQTVYEGKGMVVHPNSCDNLRMEIAKLDNINRIQGEQIEKMKWHKLDWDKAEENPDVDKLVRVRTRSGAEYICETYAYCPAEDEIGYGSVITQFSELNGDWIDDNEIEYWCYIEPFKGIKEK